MNKLELYSEMKTLLINLDEAKELIINKLNTLNINVERKIYFLINNNIFPYIDYIYVEEKLPTFIKELLKNIYIKGDCICINFTDIIYPEISNISDDQFEELYNFICKNKAIGLIM